MIRRAILSVSDKTGIVELARFLAGRGVEILSTGGTAKHLTDAGIPVTPIAQYSGAPEVFGGRVKTLTPKVFGGILYDRDVEQHAREADQHQIPPVDLVVVNLYPFEQTVAKQGVTLAEAVEQIDVGGPSMLRAAAKNHRHVLPLCDPALYAPFMAELDRGDVSSEFRKTAAIEVFRKTAAYDAAIAAFLSQSDGAAGPSLPATMPLILRKAQDLRYGENPQQQAAFYSLSGSLPFQQLHGKELSYNNLNDLDAAWRLASAFHQPACAIIKHTNPCGVGTAATAAEALRLALESDPVSAFGGVIGTNREFDLETARLVESMFLEVIVAPSFSSEASELLGRKKNLRLVSATALETSVEVRSAAGGYLVQSADIVPPPDNWRVVTKLVPSEDQMRSLQFSWTVCAHVKSNAIVLARENQSVGIGAGQMSRVDAARIAIMKSVLPAEGSVAASDAFFPFRDGLDVLVDGGVKAIVQPGGSVRDDEVIAAADERGVAMVFTGQRHFRH
jgi:phosphoribosylaminoimidazolecarboxamide formyltransferase/IMP cyclohydrolase